MMRKSNFFKQTSYVEQSIAKKNKMFAVSCIISTQRPQPFPKDFEANKISEFLQLKLFVEKISSKICINWKVEAKLILTFAPPLNTLLAAISLTFQNCFGSHY